MAKAGEVRLSTEQGKLIAHVGRKRRELSYEQAFSLGHSLLEAGHAKQAQGIFAVLARVRGRGSRAKFMLARCKADVRNFEECEQILQTVFEGEHEPIAEELQSAFVCYAIGLPDEAIREMVKVVRTHPDLSTACLFLGDLFRDAGKLDKAVKCWKLAIKRDRAGGAVAVTARKQLRQLATTIKQKTPKKARQKSQRKRRSD